MTRPRVGINLLWLLPEEAGGAEEYAVRLLHALDDVASDVVDLTLLCNRRFPGAHPELGERFRVVVAPVGGGSRVARIAAESTWLPSAASEARLHLVHHLNNVIPWIRNRPSVVTIHDLRPIALPETLGRGHGAYLRARLRPSAGNAAVITTPSEYVRGTVVELLGADPERVHVVSAPILPTTVPVEPAAIAPPGASVFLYPAITNRHKNHGTLLEAFARVAARDPDAFLVLTGAAGEAEDDVRRAVAARGVEGRVLRAGRVTASELAWWLGAATALVYPSTYEGFGLPLAEAMAAGCPVIASDRTALPEVVGDAGILVDAFDVEGWTDAMTRVAADEDLRRRFAEAGRARAARWSPAESARRQLDAYRAALEA